MKKKPLLVPLAALVLGWACSEHAVSPLEPTSEESPMKLAPRGPLFDNISNGLDAVVDPEAEIVTFNVGGASRTTQLGVVPTAGDGKNGCNLTAQSTVSFSVNSSNPAVATVSPSSVTFTSCGDVKTLTITPGTAGTAAITFTETGNTTQNDTKTGPATFDVTTARFTVVVAPPPNTAPSIAVNGVTVGGVYKKGSVPAATCQVTDAEDGNQSFAATLSAITGPNAGDGVGTQTASCSYTDAGGLQAASSVSYQIIYNDATAPLIASLLNPASPDGTNGWYKSNVSLTWTVTEGESTPTLSKTGCANQSITADQTEATYDCSATSDGGSAGPVSVKIKRDGTAPTVEYTGATPASPDGSNGWYLGNVTAAFKATDNLSGFGAPVSLTTTGTAASSGEGPAIVVTSPTFTDNAGNAASATTTFKVDKTNPSATADVTPAPNGNGWYRVNVNVKFTGSDAESGIASCTSDALFSAEGASQTGSGTCMDKAGRQSAAATVTVSIDKTAPTISGAATTAPNANDWYKNDVTIDWTCADALSGVVSCPVNSVISSEGSNLSASANITDRADNAASATVSGINIDKTDPTVSAVVNPTSPNGNGWYKANVTVTFNGSDAGSGIASCTAESTFTAEGEDQTASGTCTDKAGRTSTAATVKVSIDKTAPTITGAPTTAANAKGWYKDDVSIKWTCADALSGVVDCPVNTLLSAQGANLSANASVSDKADNSASATVSGINLDKTDPVVTPSVSPSANAYGWYKGDVTVKFNGSDALSGIDGCTADKTVSTEGASQSVQGTCTDNAGRSGTGSATVSIDKTAPTISGSPATQPNSDGWYNSNVSINWTCNDGLSGILACPTSSVISSEGSNLSASESVSDKAGNTASGSEGGINLDKSKPTNVAFSGGVSNGGIYYYSFVPVQPTCSASDALSGVKTCNVTGYSTAIGSHTLTATATDRAGNVDTATLSYTVNAWTVGGFFQPVDMNGIFNTVKNGSTVPLKFEIFAGSTELTATSSVKGFTATTIACSAAAGTDEIEITSTGGTVLRYDTTAGQFIQNWQTPKTPGACYRTTITTLDDSKITAVFQLK